MRLDAEGQGCGQLGQPFLHVLAEHKDVAALGHRDGQADGRRPVVSEHRLLWVNVGAVHFGDIAQAEKPPIGTKVDRLEALFRGELPGDANGNLLSTCVDRATRLDGVLRLQRLYQARDIETHGGELLGGELQIDLLVLRADEIDLGNVRHASSSPRRRSAWSRSSRCENPSEVSAKMRE